MGRGRARWSRFLTTPTTPPAYVLENLGLRITAYDVAGTPYGVPTRRLERVVVDAFFEFLCYLMVGLVV